MRHVSEPLRFIRLPSWEPHHVVLRSRYAFTHNPDGGLRAEPPKLDLGKAKKEKGAKILFIRILDLPTPLSLLDTWDTLGVQLPNLGTKQISIGDDPWVNTHHPTFIGTGIVFYSTCIA